MLSFALHATRSQMGTTTNIQEPHHCFVPTKLFNNYTTWKELVSKLIPTACRINPLKVYTVIAQSLHEIMERRAKKIPNKQLINFSVSKSGANNTMYY